MTKTVTLLQDAKDENNVQRRSGDSFTCSDSFAEFLANANIATYPTSNLPEVRLSADGLSLVSGDGVLIPAVGGLSTASTDAAASANVTQLQAALTIGGLVQIQAPGTYEINAPLVIGDNTEFRLARGVKLKLRSGSECNMVQSRATATPAGVGTGTVTSGSNVVTTALATSAVIGQTIVLAGAGASGEGPLVGNISAKDSTTVTLIKQDGTNANASASVAGGVCTLYTRNTNITIRGGSWDRGDNTPDSGTGPGTAIAGHSLFMSHIDGLHIDLDRVDSTHGITFVWITDCTDFQATVRAGSVVRTIMQIVGPVRNGYIPLVAGACNDDMINICGNVYVDQTDTCGDVTDIHVGAVLANGVGGSALKLNAGVGMTIDRVTVEHIGGNANVGLFIGDDYAHASTTGGTYGTIDIGYLGTTGYGSNPKSLYSFTPNVKSLSIHDGNLLPFDPIFFQGTSSSTAYEYFKLKATMVAGAVQTFAIRCFASARIKQMDLPGWNLIMPGNSSSFMRVYGTAQVDRVVVDKPLMVFSGTNIDGTRVYETGIVGEAVWRDFDVTYSDTAGTSCIGYASAGTLTKMAFEGGKLKNGAALLRVDSGAVCGSVHLSKVTADTPDRLLNLRHAACDVHIGEGVRAITPANAMVIFNNAAGSYNLYGDDIQCNTSTAKVARSTGTETIARVLNSAAQSPAFAASYTPDVVIAPVVTVGTLTNNITVNNPAIFPAKGVRVRFFFLQDGTGGRTVSWGANYIFPTAWSNTGNTLGKKSSVTFVSDGAVLVAQGANSWY